MFIALVEQYGGCDYTIGCGKAWVYLDYATREEALAHLKKFVATPPNETDDEHDYLEHNFRRGREIYLEAVTLLEVVGKGEINLDKWYKEEDEILAKEKQEAVKQQKRMEYERLKKEFGE